MNVLTYPRVGRSPSPPVGELAAVAGARVPSFINWHSGVQRRPALWQVTHNRPSSTVTPYQPATATVVAIKTYSIYKGGNMPCVL
jgi:hypothetical protein